MNNKGFSLTELIVTFAIMAIIMGMAFPAVSRLQKQNQVELYHTYETAMEKAAKLYVDQYDIDLWDRNVTSPVCLKIKYSTLLCENLVKPYSTKRKETVDTDNSYVNVTKSPDGSFVYAVHFVLKSGTKEIYNTSTTMTACQAASDSCVSN